MMVPDLEPFFPRIRCLLPGHARARALVALRAARGLHVRAQGRGHAPLGRRARHPRRRVGRRVHGGGALAVAGRASPRARARRGLHQRAAVRAARGGSAMVGRAPASGRVGTVRRLLRRECPPAHGRGRAGAIQVAAGALRRGGVHACAATRSPRCWRCSTRPTPGRTGSPTARASAARSRSSRAPGITSPTWRCRGGSPTTIPGAHLHIVPEGPHFPNRSHRAEVQGVIAAFFARIGLWSGSGLPDAAHDPRRRPCSTTSRSGIVFAAIAAHVARLIRQPLILGYIAGGIFLGPRVGLGLVTSAREQRAHLRDRPHLPALHHRAGDRPPGAPTHGTVAAGARRRPVRDQRPPRARLLRLARLRRGQRQLRPLLSRRRHLAQLDPDRRQAAAGQVRAEGAVGAADAGRPRGPGHLGHPVHGRAAQPRGSRASSPSRGRSRGAPCWSPSPSS